MYSRCETSTWPWCLTFSVDRQLLFASINIIINAAAAINDVFIFLSLSFHRSFPFEWTSNFFRSPSRLNFSPSHFNNVNCDCEQKIRTYSSSEGDVWMVGWWERQRPQTHFDFYCSTIYFPFTNHKICTWRVGRQIHLKRRMISLSNTVCQLSQESSPVPVASTEANLGLSRSAICYSWWITLTIYRAFVVVDNKSKIWECRTADRLEVELMLESNWIGSSQ